MKETKFRAIHKLTKKKWTNEELVFHNGAWYEDWRAFEDGMSLNMSQCEVMQYTGVKDKNGVEIYEGDVLTSNVQPCKMVNPIKDGYGVVRFENGMFKLGPISLVTFISKMEVIGNIYENPELLEREAK